MILTFAYLAFSAVLKLLLGRRRSDFAKDVELMLLRHQLLVLGRQKTRGVRQFGSACKLQIASDRPLLLPSHGAEQEQVKKLLAPIRRSLVSRRASAPPGFLVADPRLESWRKVSPQEGGVTAQRFRFESGAFRHRFQRRQGPSVWG